MTQLDSRLAPMARPAALLAACAPGGRSIIGGVSRCTEGEEWPLDSSGAPMNAIAEIDLESCPLKDPALGDIAVIAFFCTAGHWPRVERSGINWVAREYRKGEELAPLIRAAGVAYSPVSATWVPLDADLPDAEDWPKELREQAMHWSGEEYDAFCMRHLNNNTHKLAGWPTHLQSKPDWPDDATFRIQIASEPLANMNLGDAGILSFARTAGGVWYAEMQCY